MGLFGPNKKELFQGFNEAIGGKYSEGNWNKGPRIESRYESWTIYLDTHNVSNGKNSITYTRMRVCFKNPNQFELKITKEGVFSKIGKALGMQDILIGDDVFDENYVIKSNDEMNTVRLFHNSTLKELIGLQKKMNLIISHKKHQFGTRCDDGESVLSFMVPYVIKESSVILNLLKLFREMLNQLLELQIIDESQTSTALYKEKQEE